MANQKAWIKEREKARKERKMKQAEEAEFDDFVMMQSEMEKAQAIDEWQRETEIKGERE